MIVIQSGLRMLVSLAKLSEPAAAKAITMLVESFSGPAHAAEWRLAVSALCEVAAAYCAPETMLRAGEAVDRALQKARVDLARPRILFLAATAARAARVL